MKIAILGVGSFVFGPSALHDAIVEHRFEDLHIALFDPNKQAMQMMARVGEQMARASGHAVTISQHEQLSQAIADVHFVVSSAAVQIKQRFAMDCETVRKHYPDHLITEFGGVAGISYTLRQVKLLTDLAQQMKLHCPKAWLLTSSNPLPRVCEAVHRMGIKTAGFCSNSLQVYEAIGRVMMGVEEAYPWPQARSHYWAEMAGVNHLTWVLSMQESNTGRDVTHDFVDRLQNGAGGVAANRPLSMELLATYGKYPPNGDTHMADFLPPSPHVRALEDSSHGTAEERQKRLATLEEVAAGKAPYERALEHRAWEKPMDFVAAIACRKPIRFSSLNLANTGQLPQLPQDLFVETSATASDGSVIPTRSTLPPAIAAVCRSTAELHSLIAQAAMNRDRRRLFEAVERDPTITDKGRGEKALAACMQVHSDLIGRW